MEKETKKKRVIPILFLLIILLVGIFLYAKYINTKGFKVKEIAIANPNLPEAFDGLKIVHFSDLHYGRTINKDDLKKIATEINELNADIIIFTGDVFDSKEITEEKQRDITDIFRSLNAKLFKFAVIGDYDENYLSTYKDILDKSNFILLNNENKLVYHNSTTPLNIIGLTNQDKIKELYDNDYFNITLMHKPDLINAISNSQIAFAGHSLGGQIKLPFIDGVIKKDGARTYINSYYKVNNTDLYISNGLGTENISLRLFNKPSISLYRLYN